MAVNGAYFDYRDGDRTAKACFLVGANWQDRVQYGFTWHNPNGLRLAEDARKMAAAGMRIVRSHYMLPGWMRTVPWQIYASAVPGTSRQFELGPELSERHARALEAHIMIFNSLGILFQPTVFTLSPPQMGNPSSWGGSTRLAACPGLVENQERFSRQMNERFGRVPGVVWDLINEANYDMTRYGEWLALMKPIWGRTGQLVGIGGGSGILSNVQLGEAADWHALHRSPVFHDEGFHTGKPHLLQEAWIDTATTFAGETDLGRLTSLGVAITLHDQGAGYMPWNWNQFYANWRYGTKFVELWDNDLGACVHADLTPRRGGIMLRNWAVLLDGVSFDQQANRQVVFVYPKTFYAGEGTADYLNVLYNHHVPFRAVNDADFAHADLAAARLVVLPYTARGYRESTWRRLPLPKRAERWWPTTIHCSSTRTAGWPRPAPFPCGRDANRLAAVGSTGRWDGARTPRTGSSAGWCGCSMSSSWHATNRTRSRWPAAAKCDSTRNCRGLANAFTPPPSRSSTARAGWSQAGRTKANRWNATG